jgi:hypothetical protein
MILGHHTRHWMYPGMVFCTSTLDGESFPLVTQSGRRDFVERLNFDRFEVVNNPYLWGTASFYMPSIWQFGPSAKGENPHPAWSWRMARGAQAMFAHLENGTMFADQGGSVYGGYSQVLQEWGALSADVEFVPWFKIASEVEVLGQGGETLVSYYRGNGRVLLIVSNREKQERQISLKLDFAKLGLAEDANFEILEGAYERPEGIDPWQAAKSLPNVEQQKLKLGEDTDFNIEDLGGLEDPEKVAKEQAREVEPSLKGNVLTVPVRAHDFRVIALD